MARLLVTACEAKEESMSTIRIGVSVSRSDDGKPVTGLTKSNFRVASPLTGKDFKVASVDEMRWELADVDPAGCYQITVTAVPLEEFKWGGGFNFGLQVRKLVQKKTGGKWLAVDHGQTIIELWTATQ